VRIIAFYSLISVLWLGYFAYTTLWLMFIYGRDTYSALLNISLTLLHLRAFDLTAVGLNVATISYFGLFMAGFVVMGVVASKNIRMRGVRLETIHDKRMSAFLPIPSPLPLKLGKVDQSLEDMRGEMRRIEHSFRSLHRDFVLRHQGSDAFPTKKAMADNLLELAKQFPPAERGQAVSAASRFLRRQDEKLVHLLESAFGTVWTLELSPADYTRIKHRIFPSLIAEDLGTSDLPGDLEEFKKQTVLGSDALAQLSGEIEEESKEVFKNPEVYQVTAYLEPMKSRLVFVGRTDKVAGSVVWLGGLYLYQAWASYTASALDDSALRLRSIRLSRSTPLTKAQLTKLRDSELRMLKEDLGRMESLSKAVDDAMSKMESTYESAVNFNETLDSLVSDEVFDVGLYKPIMTANGRHLEGFNDKFANFRAEFGRVAKRLALLGPEVEEELANRRPQARSWTKSVLEAVRSTPLAGGSSKQRSPAFDSEVKQLFAASRLVYGVVIASDIIL